MKCLIESKVYDLDKKMMQEVFKLVKEKYKKENKHAVYALYKEGIYDLKRIESNDFGKILEYVKTYEDKGFTVFYM